MITILRYVVSIILTGLKAPTIYLPKSWLFISVTALFYLEKQQQTNLNANSQLYFRFFILKNVSDVFPTVARICFLYEITGGDCYGSRIGLAADL